VVFYFTNAEIIDEATPIGLGSLGALPVAFVVWAIGLGLGGTTGYAINPARDLGPRIAHAFLPIKQNGSSQWKYAWIPIIGPFIGAIIAGLLYLLLNNKV
jgi:glycerol uptake facilitator protein